MVVTVNYRLGYLGYLAAEAFAKENAAWPSTGGANLLHDQVVALEFTRAIAASFGGDVDRVTVFGESAGSLSGCMLSAGVPGAKGLFRSAVLESGPCQGPWGPVDKSAGLAAGRGVMEALNASTPAALRALPWQAFLTVVPVLPSVDGLVLPALPLAVLEAGGPVNAQPVDRYRRTLSREH